jgi:N-acetylglucosaminyl-diphospho-decaprenol L-rhamnosyltransferase
VPVNRPRENPGSASRPRLTIVIVNYESWADTVRLLGSLASQPEVQGGACEVVVVDNASRGPVPAELSSPRPGVRLIARTDNGGFAAGVNAGWQAARSPWFLVLNPDVEVAAGFVHRVFDRLDRFDARGDDAPGIVGFGLLNADGSTQGSVGRFPSLARSIREQFIPRSRRKYQPGWRSRAGRVDWVTGACMLVNAAVIDDVGGMDEDFFLYHEEVAFCRVARRRGWQVEFEPGVSVVHRDPLQNRAISPKMRVIIRHSKLLYFRKHLPRWEFRTLAAIVRLESAIRGGWSVLRGRRDEAGAWAAIVEIAGRLRRGRSVRGREVLLLAESIARPPDETGSGDAQEPRGSRESPEMHSRPARRPRRARRTGGKPLGR